MVGLRELVVVVFSRINEEINECNEESHFQTKKDNIFYSRSSKCALSKMGIFSSNLRKWSMAIQSSK
jgi:hypothetical protein